VRIIEEEAERLLSKVASEGELRKAEKRILRRLEGDTGPSRMSGRSSVRSGVIESGRSAISKASNVLSEMESSRSRGSNQPMLKNPKQEGAYDYWLRFMEMDVQNFQREEQVRKAEQKRRMEDQKRYLDEQVTMKSKAKSAARQADLSWGLEIKKDYNKWQEENIVAEAKAIQQRKMFVQATDAQLAEVEARRMKELNQESRMDQQMLDRVRQEMEREKEKMQLKKAEDSKMMELTKMQNAKLQKQKNDLRLNQEHEEMRLQKQYADILLKQEKAHKAKQRAFMEDIERKASRFDDAAKEANAKGAAGAAAAEAAEKKAVEDAKEQYRKDMLEASEKQRGKHEKAKKEFKDALKQQLSLKAEQERLEKEDCRQQMKELKRELNNAAKKEEEKARRIAEANYQNKLAIDAQIREKQRQREVGRYMSQAEREMNLNLIRKVEQY